ncbi:MAG: papain-like cysteine protease family protein [Chitinispirillia bacterium]|jgi:hypothetical protein
MLFIFQISTADRILDYPRIQQEQSNWCWNACAQWILGFHGTEVSQTEICKYAFVDGKVKNFGNFIYTATDTGDMNMLWKYPEMVWDTARFYDEKYSGTNTV